MISALLSQLRPIGHWSFVIGHSAKGGSRLVLLALTALAAGGCTSAELTRVQPWERAALAGYTMNPARDPLHTAMSEHIYFSREASSGGRGVGGSGCGCN